MHNVVISTDGEHPLLFFLISQHQEGPKQSQLNEKYNKIILNSNYISIARVALLIRKGSDSYSHSDIRLFLINRPCLFHIRLVLNDYMF